MSTFHTYCRNKLDEDEFTDMKNDTLEQLKVIRTPICLLSMKYLVLAISNNEIVFKVSELEFRRN